MSYKIKKEFLGSQVSVFGKGSIILTENLPQEKIMTLININHPAIYQVEKPKKNEAEKTDN